MQVGQQAARGLFFILFGGFSWWLGQGMPIGTAGDMGVGYVPRMLSFGCIGVGGALLLAALVRLGPQEAMSFAWKPMLIVTALVVAFGLLLPLAGLPLTIVLVVLAASVSGEAFDWRGLLATAIMLACVSTLLFHTLLRLQVPVWPTW